MSTIVIDQAGDQVIRVSVVEIIKSEQGTTKCVKEAATFQLSREILTQSSNWFKETLQPYAFKEGFQSQLNIEADSTEAFEIWFRIIHGQDATTNVDLKVVWMIILIADKYDFAIDVMNSWFDQWYERQPIDRWLREWAPGATYQDLTKDPRCLLLPSWRFDNAGAFLRITRFLVYNCAFHVTEANPIGAWQLHMPSRVIQQLNAARGRLKTIVFNPLYAPIKSVLQVNTRCCDRTQGDYQRALIATKAWPLEELGQKNSMQRLLNRLGSFRYNASEMGCMKCKQDYEAVVRGVVQNAQGYFDGLCLDCMNASKAKTENSDTDYWEHDRLTEKDWIKGCRVRRHKQPTWYFSFMGRREERDRVRKEKPKQQNESRNGTPGSPEPSSWTLNES